MSDESVMQHVKLVETKPGTFDLEIDGRDVTEDVVAMQVSAVARELTQIVVTLARPSLHFDGYARVRVAETDPGPAAAVFLAAIDPEELEKAALNRTDLGNDRHALTAAMLRQLGEWASGRP